MYIEFLGDNFILFVIFFDDGAAIEGSELSGPATDFSSLVVADGVARSDAS